MKKIASTILRNLKRPLPELYVYITDKIVSYIWTFYIKDVGKGLYVSSGSKIRGGKFITIGEHFHTGCNLWLDAIGNHLGHTYTPQIIIGNWVSASNNLHIAATTSIIIGDGALIGSNVHITDHAHGVYSGDNQDSPDLQMPIFRKLAHGKSVELGENVWIGDGVVILPGVKIGKGSIIGANSVVSKSIPENVIAVGSPAKPIKQYNVKSQIWEKV